MQTATIILGIAALGGMVLATIRLRGAPRPPTWMALGHGALASTGVGILIYTALTTGLPALAQVALGMFLLAAAGGTFLFVGFHLPKRPLPIPFVIGHGLLALTALTMLVVALY